MKDQEWERIRQTLKVERAVSRPVAEAREYLPFARDSGWVRGLFPDIPSAQWGATFGRMVKRTSGIVIPKHPVPGEPRIMPQLRPDEPVELWSPERHRHDGPQVHTGGLCDCGARHEAARTDEAMSRRDRQRHEDGKKHADSPHDEPNHQHRPVDGWHEHPRDPKYLLAPSPLVDVGYFHLHNEQTSPAHLQKPPPEGHGGEIPDGTHSHRRRMKDREHKRELRIDVHPASLRMLQEGVPRGRAFFSIEGSIKADAILSAGEPAFAVPSVTMWPAPELERFARRYLWPSTRVYVVPDADWSTKPEVALQAFVCVDALRRYEVEAAVAAVPRDAGHKGIDDYLADGGRLDDLTVYRRKLTQAFQDFTDEVRRRRGFGEIRARDRLADVLRFIVLHADEQGRCRRPGRTIARYSDLSTKRLDALLGAFADRDDITWDLDGEPFLTFQQREGWDVDHNRRSRFGEFWVRPEIRARTIERRLAED